MGYPTGYWPLGWWPFGYLPIVNDEPLPGDEAGGGDGYTPAPLLALPASPEAVAWAAFARLVRASPELRGVGTTLRTWDGSGGDDRVPDSVTDPWLRFTPLAGRKERWATGGVWHCPIMVHVDQVSPGTNATDSINLHGALMGLIESPAFRAAMAEAGASSVTFDEGGYGERPNLAKYEPNPEATITAIGTITIDMFVQYEG